MSLIEIKNHLMQVRIASLASISSYFNADPELLRNMLEHWIRKGKVRRLAKTANCGGKCNKCSPLVTELYEWITWQAS